MFGADEDEELDCVCLVEKAAVSFAGIGNVCVAFSSRLDVWARWQAIAIGNDYVWDVYAVHFCDTLPRSDRDKMGVLHKFCDHDDDTFDHRESSR